VSPVWFVCWGMAYSSGTEFVPKTVSSTHRGLDSPDVFETVVSNRLS
jgi:hypothetical protein